MGLALRPEHAVLPGRLFPVSQLPALGADYLPDAAQGRPDRFRFHAHGVGAAGAGLCDPAAAAGAGGIDGADGARGALHLWHAPGILPLSAEDESRSTAEVLRAVQVTGAGLKSTSALCSFHCSAQVF